MDRNQRSEALSVAADMELLYEHDSTHDEHEHDAVHERIYLRLGNHTDVDQEHEWLDELRGSDAAAYVTKLKLERLVADLETCMFRWEAVQNEHTGGTAWVVCCLPKGHDGEHEPF